MLMTVKTSMNSAPKAMPLLSSVPALLAPVFSSFRPVNFELR
jgi:hypothetical protein